MVFSSLLFIFGFLPAFLLVYYLTPRRWKNLTALIASYVFYAWGAPKFAFVLFGASILDYLFGKAIYRYRRHVKQKRLWLIISLALNLGLLGYFKYANFFVGEFSHILTSLGMTAVHWTHVALPIGISFFTFQKISYIVDVYRGKVKPAKRFVDFALYVALFPQLIAGPIVRYFDIAEQLKKRSHRADKFFDGMWRFTLGLSKKVLIANQMGLVADSVFALHPESLTTPYAWVGILAYAFQIYFDFSGYSDMAIGLGKMMGFDILENFNKPYISESFTEFWRRWHISLSNWMKEYLYIPLGGNRVSEKRMYANLWIVFLLSGLWHGASWTFVVWGAYHGLFLTLDKVFWLKLSYKLHRFITVPITFVFILIGWVFFRSETFSFALQFIHRMFDFASIGVMQSAMVWPEIISNRGMFIMIVAAVISFIPLFNWFRAVVKLGDWWLPPTVVRLGQGLLIVSLFVLSTISLANASFNPFIYFRF